MISWENKLEQMNNAIERLRIVTADFMVFFLLKIGRIV